MTIEPRFVHCALNPDGTRGAWYVFTFRRFGSYKRVAKDGPGTRMEADRLAHSLKQ